MPGAAEGGERERETGEWGGGSLGDAAGRGPSGWRERVGVKGEWE